MTEELLLIGVAAPHAATMYCEIPIPRAPTKSTGRRPNLSMAKRPGNVDRTLTTLVITVRMNGDGNAEALREAKYEVP